MNITDLYELFVHHRTVTTDSRNCPAGSLFFALKGERFDGNQYAEAALAKGAAYAIIDNPKYQTGERTILVEDSLKDRCYGHKREDNYQGVACRCTFHKI